MVTQIKPKNNYEKSLKPISVKSVKPIPIKIEKPKLSVRILDGFYAVTERLFYVSIGILIAFIFMAAMKLSGIL